MIRIYKNKNNLSFKIKNSLFISLKKRYFNLRFTMGKRINIKLHLLTFIRKNIAVVLTAINRPHNV